MQNQIQTVAFVVNSASATQTLPFGLKAASVLGAVEELGGATAYAAESLAVVTGAPGSGDVQFTGTPEAPSGTLTLSAAPAANGKLTVTFIAPGDIPAAQ